MTRVHVLSPGFDTPNGQAFLFPLVVWRRELEDAGIQCRIFGEASDGVTDCDVLLVDSKFHRDRWQHGTAAVLEEFSHWAVRCRVIYCDTTDSSGWLQQALLPIVHVYAKAQLLKDRAGYLQKCYAHRPYADYYHRTLNIEDREPEWSVPVSDPKLLAKLRVSWNSGLADWSLHGPLRMALYDRVPLKMLLRFPRGFTPASAARARPFSCRFGISYPRRSVAAQREMIRQRLAQHLDTTKLSRRVYFNELRTSRVVVSPFGYGEITLKDFEVFLTGGMLFKPDMTHMETWPDLFRAGETMLTHAWDLSDFERRLELASADAARARDIAEAGQENYRAYLAGSDAAHRFVTQLRSVLH